MRLYPSATILGRLTVQDDELMGQHVPARTTVVVVPWHDPPPPRGLAGPLVFDP